MHAFFKRRATMLAALLVSVGVIALSLFMILFQTDDPDVRGGPIAMASTDGAFSLSRLEQDQVAVVSFGYTYCPDVCPITLAVKRQALAQLDEAERARVVPVMVTVDLERDTLARMREYMQAFGEEFIGLVGSPGELEDVAQRYGVVWERVDMPDSRMAYTVDHSASLFLVDREGEILEQVLYSPTPGALVSALNRELERLKG